MVLGNPCEKVIQPPKGSQPTGRDCFPFKEGLGEPSFLPETLLIYYSKQSTILYFLFTQLTLIKLTVLIIGTVYHYASSI